MLRLEGREGQDPCRVSSRQAAAAHASDLVHWWNLDLHRSDHPVAFIIDIGGRMRPVITPQDAAGVTAELVYITS